LAHLLDTASNKIRVIVRVRFGGLKDEKLIKKANLHEN